MMEEIEFNKFCKENYNKQVNKIKRILRGDEATALDIVQSSYEKAWKYRKSFNPKKSGPVQWFNSILYNTMRDEINIQQLEKIDLLFEEFNEFSLESHINEVSNSTHRTVLKLALQKGYKGREIQRFMGPDYTSGDTRKIVFRFKEKLKEEF